MKSRMLAAVFLAAGYVCSGALFAAGQMPTQAAAGVEQPDFSPPPVPEFMLRKPAQPLTLEQMKEQADAAARRARAEKDKQAAPLRPPAQPGAEGAK